MPIKENFVKIKNYLWEIPQSFRLDVAVYRKGATRALAPKSPETPERYKKAGQLVLIPGSMGAASYVLANQEAGRESFFSICHGAGRAVPRKQATRTVSGGQAVKELNQRGIIVKCHSQRGIAEEAPLAYKDVEEVAGVVDKAGLSAKVAKLNPLAVIKSE